MPLPVSRSMPTASMSIALLVSAVLIWAGVSAGLADLIKPAIAAAVGAAHDVPKNGLPKPPTPVTELPSEAAMRGCWKTVPPVEEKFPGVKAVPSPWKKLRRGPSELNVSVLSAAV